jgi:tripartite-type tricarboxylate transporter receptor subunit TctC
MKRCNRVVARLVVALGCVAAAAGVAAQTRYPERAVKILGGNIGGLPDTVSRVVAQKLAENWGQPVVNENRPSAAGSVIAAELVAKAAPDGYTLLVSDGNTLITLPVIYKNLPYSPGDLVPVALAARAPLFIAVLKPLPVNTLVELVALARAQPGMLNYGTSGVGSTHHLSMEYIKLALGLDMVHIPYKGSGQSVPALLSGQVQIVLSAYPSLVTHAKAGTVKLLASNSIRRSVFAPDVPTVAEAANIPGYDFAPPIGFIGPAGLPRDIMNRIAAGVAQAVKHPEVSAKLMSLGIDPVGGSPEEYAAQIKSDKERYARAIMAAGVQAE